MLLVHSPFFVEESNENGTRCSKNSSINPTFSDSSEYGEWGSMVDGLSDKLSGRLELFDAHSLSSDHRSIKSSSSGRSQSKISSSERCNSFVAKFVLEFRVACRGLREALGDGSVQKDSGSFRFFSGCEGWEKSAWEVLVSFICWLLVIFQFFSFLEHAFSEKRLEHCQFLTLEFPLNGFSRELLLRISQLVRPR